MADDAGSTMEGPFSEPWEPLSVVDVSLLGLVGTFQAFAVLICVHLICCRKWPPYVTKNVDLVVTSAVAGALSTIAVAISFGFFRREQGDFLASCNFEVGAKLQIGMCALWAGFCAIKGSKRSHLCMNISPAANDRFVGPCHRKDLYMHIGLSLIHI